MKSCGGGTPPHPLIPAIGPPSSGGPSATVGPIRVQRALPLRGRRLIGPWCFLDRFGPLTFNEATPMDVAPHPHMGLQTVTWLQQGELVHHDSLRSEGSLRPGGVNVMTSGHAIAHAERTPTNNTGRLGGVQLWTALPDRDRGGPASFQHLPEVPVLEMSGGLAHVFSGTLWNATSPASHFSSLVGADLQVHAHHSLTVPIEREHEHAVLILAAIAPWRNNRWHPESCTTWARREPTSASPRPTALASCSLAACRSLKRS